jgi:hypothetical protein
MSENAQSKDFALILGEIMNGKREPPNYEDVDLSKGVATIAAWGGAHETVGIKHVKIPGFKSSNWSRFFLGSTQGGDFDGTGYIMWWDNGAGHIGKFAICQHERTGGGTREQEMRGWHPGRCAKCGLDMSIDSGD